MVNGNPFFMEAEMRRRSEEFRLQADQFRLARLAEGGPKRRGRLDLGGLKCRALDVLAGLGLALERCEARPLPTTGAIKPTC